jgi:hypothetical protein
MPGWKRPNPTVSAALCLLATAAGGAPGVQPDPAEQDRKNLPEAFLVFLGEWEDPQGNWQDPLEFDDPKWQVLDKDAERRNETE